MNRRLMVAGMFALTAFVASARNKMIAYGWDVLRTGPENILANAAAWENVPLDGVVFSLNAKAPDGTLLMHRRVTTDRGWTYEAFAPQVAAMRELVAKRPFAHSMAGALFQYSKKARLDWTDDAAWANFANNMGVLARIVREAGLEGVCIDNEDYGKIRQFYRKDGEPPYAELRQLARRRGREVFAPVFREKPDIALLAFWFLSYDAEYLTASDLMAKETELEDLWPAFIEGMLEVMPVTATFHDGNEKAYYYRADSGDYYRSAVRIQSKFAALLEPAYRDRYRARVRASAGFYMDNYVQKDPKDYHYLPPTVGGTQTDRFADNLAQADDASEGYVWFYGERHPWIDWQGAGDQTWRHAPTWDDAMPGLYDIFRARKDPLGFAKARSAALDKAGAPSLPLKFDQWQHKKDAGRIRADKQVGRAGSGAFRLENVKRGCKIAYVKDVPQGRTCLVRAYTKGGKPSGTVYYTQDCAWRFPLGRAEMTFETTPDADGWSVGYAVVTVPPGADGFGVQFGGVGDGTIWYDGIGIYSLR